MIETKNCITFLRQLRYTLLNKNDVIFATLFYLSVAAMIFTPQIKLNKFSISDAIFMKTISVSAKTYMYFVLLMLR